MPAYFIGDASAANCTGEPAYDWNFGDGSSHGALQNPSHTYTVAGSFTWTLTVTVADQVCTKTGTVNVQAVRPGDCDLGGTISIGEVQKAINMFLGVASVECGVDCGADGAVSIGEVQKVINGFLGMDVSC
jgi:PKD repeat protein